MRPPLPFSRAHRKRRGEAAAPTAMFARPRRSQRRHVHAAVEIAREVIDAANTARLFLIDVIGQPNC